jgi:hypothetical protein
VLVTTTPFVYYYRPIATAAKAAKAEIIVVAVE